MRATRSASALGLSALVICVLSSAAAQDRVSQREPFIRVYSPYGAYVTSSYVEPKIEVAEDAYVFAVSMDLDGQIQVLHPDFPGISVRLRAHKALQLPKFFAGFAQQGPGTTSYSSAYRRYGSDFDDPRGTVIALASRQPFNLERIESDGDWNMSAIRRLIENRSPSMAAQDLAVYLGAKGEPIGRDYMRFAGRRNYYASDYGYGYGYDACDFYGYGSNLAFSRTLVLNRVAALRRGGQDVRVLGFDICGMPIVAYGRSLNGPGVRPPLPHAPGDTVFPKGRLPHGVARHPGDTTQRQAALGFFPPSRRAEPAQMGDVTITAPTGRRAEPREVLEQFRSRAGGMTLPERATVPIERTVPSRVEPAATGFQPAREYRPEPRVIAPPPSEPVRVPERIRESPPPPPPVIHDRPAPPPPRAETAPAPRETPPPKSEPASVPPPKR